MLLSFITEAVARRCSVKKVFLEISLNSQVNKKEALAQVFSYEFWKISKNTFSQRTPPVAASAIKSIKPSLIHLYDFHWHWPYTSLTFLVRKQISLFQSQVFLWWCLKLFLWWCLQVKSARETFSIADDWLLITHISSPDYSCFVFQANQIKTIESNRIKSYKDLKSFELFLRIIQNKL